MTDFILTGATGFLGSHLMAALLARGDRVLALGRASRDASLAERIAAILAWFGLEECAGRVEPVQVDLLAPDLGLEPARYAALCAWCRVGQRPAPGPAPQVPVSTRQGPLQVVHLASDTRFARSNLSRSIQSNVESLEELVKLTVRSGARCLHHVSTAYVAGETHSPCREEPVRPRSFANIYEETKASGEARLIELCTRYGIPYTILRPSIVYGDSRTGASNSFTALYHHVKALALIKELYLEDIRLRGGVRAQACGIGLEPDGVLRLPLRIELPQPGTVNLIPIDYFVAATLKVLDRPEAGSIYHLTSATPCTMEELADYCERFLGIRGLEIVYPGAARTGSLTATGARPAGCPAPPPAGTAPTPPTALFNKMIEPYRPYLSDTRRFERRNLDRATGGLQPPRLDYPVFQRCMEYAVRAEWGNALPNMERAQPEE